MRIGLGLCYILIEVRCVVVRCGELEKLRGTFTAGMVNDCISY